MMSSSDAYDLAPHDVEGHRGFDCGHAHHLKATVGEAASAVVWVSVSENADAIAILNDPDSGNGGCAAANGHACEIWIVHASDPGIVHASRTLR